MNSTPVLPGSCNSCAGLSAFPQKRRVNTQRETKGGLLLTFDSRNKNRVKRGRKRSQMKPNGQNGGNMKIGTLKALSHAVSASWVWVFALSVLAIGICPSLAMGDDGDHRSIQV